MSDERTAEQKGRDPKRSLWRLIAAVVERPVTVTMVTVALLLFGLVALTRMPVELLPGRALFS